MIELLYEALNTPMGVVVETNNVELAKAQLYKIRKSDPALACLSLVTSPTNPTGEIWITKHETRPDETHPEPSSG